MCSSDLILHPSLSFKELNCVSENDLDFNTQVFAHSRFHQDPRISSKQADELWNQYLKNFKVSSNQKAFCATQAEEKLGLILTQLNFETSEACLFYVAVKPNSRGLGIGSFLINNTLKVLSDFNCFTEVYCRNLKALNFYLGNGLNMIKSTQSVLHRWAK